MLEAAAEALFIISDLNRLMFVALGTLLGLMIGVIPGIGFSSWCSVGDHNI